MDTKANHKIRFWVTAYDETAQGNFAIDAVSLEDEEVVYGLLSHYRQYTGELMVISPNVRRVIHGEVSTTHRQSRGWQWHVETAEFDSVAPFLLTDEFGTHCVFDGIVSLSGNDKVADLLEDAGVGSAIPLAGENWFGVITLQGLGSAPHGRLVVFSEAETVNFLDRVSARWFDVDENVNIMFGG